MLLNGRVEFALEQIAKLRRFAFGEVSAFVPLPWGNLAGSRRCLRKYRLHDDPECSAISVLYRESSSAQEAEKGLAKPQLEMADYVNACGQSS